MLHDHGYRIRFAIDGLGELLVADLRDRALGHTLVFTENLQA
jgi:hypothetical protein